MDECRPNRTLFDGAQHAEDGRVRPGAGRTPLAPCLRPEVQDMPRGAVDAEHEQMLLGARGGWTARLLGTTAERKDALDAYPPTHSSTRARRHPTIPVSCLPYHPFPVFCVCVCGNLTYLGPCGHSWSEC